MIDSERAGGRGRSGWRAPPAVAVVAGLVAIALVVAAIVLSASRPSAPAGAGEPECVVPPRGGRVCTDAGAYESCGVLLDYDRNGVPHYGFEC